MIHRIFIVVLLGWFCLSVSPAAEPNPATLENLSPDMASQATKSRTAMYRVDFRVAIKAPANTKKLRVWLPLPPSDDCQTISDRRLATLPRPVNPLIESEPEFGNTFAYFQFDSPDGAQLITHQFTAEIRQLDWGVDYGRVRRPEAWPQSFARFQRADPRGSEGDRLREVLDQINSSPEVSSDAHRLLGAMQWIDRNLTYDPVNASLSADPMHAMVHRRGHCSDYHGLCGTLASQFGFPSRVLYGLQMFDKGSPSHCKLEVFVPPYGWVTYDLSETQKLALRTAGDASLTSHQRESRVRAIKQRTMRGFRENTWLLVTRGVNYALAPAASKPVPIVREIYAEADGVAFAEPGQDDGSPTTWMTIHRVDEIGKAARRFDQLDLP